LPSPRLPHQITHSAVAQVVELVDTQVSEACALTAWGFEYNLCRYNLLIYQYENEQGRRP